MAAVKDYAESLHKPISRTIRVALRAEASDAAGISAFLNHLELERHNSVRTRNVQLTALRSVFSYADLRHPSMRWSSSA